MSTTAEIKTRILNAIIHEMKKIDQSYENDPLNKSPEEAYATALSGEIKLINKGIEEAVKQGCPLTATSKTKSSNGMLEKWGFAILGRLPYGPTRGIYTITITWTGTAKAGTQYIDNLTNFVYVLQSEVVCAGTGSGTVKSVGEGAELVKPAGTVLYSQQNFDGITSEVIISEILTAPVDAEDLEIYRDLIITALRITPRGGAIGDYIIWGLEVEGTFKIFPYVSNVPTEGLVYVMAPRTDLNPTGLAPAELIEDVKDYINLKEPMTTGETTILSVVERNYEVTVTGLTDATKEPLVLPALEAYFAEKYPFIDGVDNEDLRTDRITKADIMGVVYNAVFPAGISDVSVTSNAVPMTDEYLPAGNVGAVTAVFS